MNGADQIVAAAAQQAQGGRPDLAAQALQGVLQAEPMHVEANRLLGLCLFQTGPQAAGVAAMERAVAAAPSRGDLHFMLGSMIAVMGQVDRAIPVLEKAAELDPRSAPVRGLLATCYLQKKDLDAALELYREAVALDPKYAEARSNLGSVLQSTGQPQEACEVLRAAARDHAQHPGLLTAYCVSLNYAEGVEPAEIKAAHEHYGRVLAGLPGAVQTQWPNARDPEKKIRVGVVSPDLWDHSVAFFLRPILESADRGKLEFILYATGPMRDAMTQRLMAASSGFRDCARMNDAQLLQQIRADGVDVVLDLAGQTQGSRLTALRLRGAPVQATYIGYPNTTGVQTIDCRIVDAITDPAPGADAMATEKLVRLPGCFLCYGAPEGAPGVAPPPRDANGFVTFGSFNAIKKFAPGTIALWARVLHAAPNSRLVIKSGGLSGRTAREHVAGVLKREGIPEVRFQLLDKFESKREHLEAYGGIDIALDTTPYNGTTTTCEALWMGVPVVSLATGLHAGRVGLSLLTAVGLPELVADTPDGYVEIARGLAECGPRTAELRRTMRERVARSVLCDAAGFAPKFEAAVRGMWAAWCAGER